MAIGIKGNGTVQVDGVEKKRSQLTDDEVVKLWKEEDRYLEEIEFSYVRVMHEERGSGG